VKDFAMRRPLKNTNRAASGLLQLQGREHATPFYILSVDGLLTYQLVQDKDDGTSPDESDVFTHSRSDDHRMTPNAQPKPMRCLHGERQY
jgi:hypothetical protein